MKTTLKNYQASAAGECNQYLTKLCAISDADATANSSRAVPDLSKVTALQLIMPCGMGKTVTLAAVLSGDTSLYQADGEVHDNEMDRKLILFVTPGKGGLAEQSYERLKFELGDTRNVIYLGDGVVPPTSDLAGTIVVANYEMLVQTDKDGNAKNRVTREGESASYWDMLLRAKEGGITVIIVIDESHYGAKSGNSAIGKFFAKVAKTLGYAPLRIEATATPRAVAGADDARLGQVVRTASQGVFAGLLRENVVVNKFVGKEETAALKYVERELPQLSPDPPEYVVLAHVASRLHESLRTTARSLSDGAYLPLMLVVLHDDIKGVDKGSAELSNLKAYFAKRGQTVENGKLAVWLSGDPDSIAYADKRALSSDASKVEVLIVKQAVALGWDCPRAQIMLNLRESSQMSATFSEQLLGRIMRQTGGTTKTGSSSDALLNSAYAYTACNEGYIQRHGDRSQKEASSNEDDFRYPYPADAAQLALWGTVGAVRRIATRTARGAAKLEDFAKALRGVPLAEITLLTGDYHRRIISDTVVTATTKKVVGNAVSTIPSSTSAAGELGPALTEFFKNYSGLVDAKGDPYTIKSAGRYSDNAKPVLVKWVSDSLAQHGVTGEDANAVILANLTDPNGAMKPAFDAVAAIAAKRELTEARNGYTPSDWLPYTPAQRRMGTYANTTTAYPAALAATHLFGEFRFDDRRGSQYEERFESEVIGGLLGSTVKSWVRNSEVIDGDGSSASLTYVSAGNKVSTTFPDYVALLDTADGIRPFLFEVKGLHGRDGGDGAVVASKAKALAEMTADTGHAATMRGAVVYPSEKSNAWTVVTGAGEMPLREWLKGCGVTV